MNTASAQKEKIPMNELRPGESGTVRAIRLHGSIRRRIQDIGLICGTPVQCVGVSPLGDPAAYRIRGAVIAIRRDDSRNIDLERLTQWE